MQICEKIRKIREFKNYSQEYVANQLGISQNVYGRIERGLQDLTIDRLKKIAIIFEVSEEELICKTFTLKPTHIINENNRSEILKNYIQNSRIDKTHLKFELMELVKQNTELINILKEKL